MDLCPGLGSALARGTVEVKKELPRPRLPSRTGSGPRFRTGPRRTCALFGAVANC